MAIDKELLKLSTPAQKKVLLALGRTKGDVRKAATALGYHPRTVEKALAAVKKLAAYSGYSPAHDMTHTVPAGFVVKGVSTFYDKDGKPTNQWVKSKLDDEARTQAMLEFIKDAAESLPRLPLIAAPSSSLSELCNVYTLTDSHFGALAWGEETGGQDWDLEIAERTLTACLQRMVISAPKAKVGILAQLGDFLHQDGINALTPTSGHLLDASARFYKIIQAAVNLLRNAVDFLLQHHEEVVVLMGEGNHDITSSMWLQAIFSALYENEPRVKVMKSPMPYYAYQHGETMLGWHHGHLKRNDDLPGVFAARFAEMWGNTKKRYIHTGHRHHVEEKEHNGVIVVQHATLAAPDAHSSRHGYNSERQVRVMTYHRKYGEVGRVVITPEMVGS
jgi:hypothetical protein